MAVQLQYMYKHIWKCKIQFWFNCSFSVPQWKRTIVMLTLTNHPILKEIAYHPILKEISYQHKEKTTSRKKQQHQVAICMFFHDTFSLNRTDSSTSFCSWIFKKLGYHRAPAPSSTLITHSFNDESCHLHKLCWHEDASLQVTHMIHRSTKINDLSAILATCVQQQWHYH